MAPADTELTYRGQRARAVREAGEVVIGEDWSDPAPHPVPRGERASSLTLARSPLARKIVTFNLLALVILVAGVLYLNPYRDSLVTQREAALATEAELVAAVIEARLPQSGPVNLQAGDGADPRGALDGVVLPADVDAYLLAPSGALLASRVGPEGNRLPEAVSLVPTRTVVSDALGRLWGGLDALLGGSRANGADAAVGAAATARALVPYALTEGAVSQTVGRARPTSFWVATPIEHDGRAIGVLAMATGAGRIDALAVAEREQVLQMFVLAILVSVGLSLVLASTIANPLSQLSAAAEFGQGGRRAKSAAAARVRIPDLTARPDEIGRLSGALRSMTDALYDRIDANEQFAADVAHEIKNPLASLRSAVGTMHVAKRDDQRQKLLEIIEHDVRRLDRLVSDISNASRLDAEVVKEDEEPLNLIQMIGTLAEHFGREAEEKGIEVITDLPPGEIVVRGLEARLAQVFVNLISNAISFTAEGDAIRIWVRRRQNRVLIVVEDTGPGIPDDAIHKIFTRFYSHRPGQEFGNNSGLGLAISKQIVDAHGGVIWAENIRDAEAGPAGDPLGARFVVGLPV